MIMMTRNGRSWRPPSMTSLMWPARTVIEDGEKSDDRRQTFFGAALMEEGDGTMHAFYGFLALA